jgi:hypothetical protein
MDWRLRIGPDRVEDLGTTPVVPELDAVDELLYRAARHRSMDDMADLKVQAAAVALMDGAYHDAQDTNYISIGMMGDTSVRHRTKDAFVCLQTDDAGPLTFVMTRESGGFYISDMEVPAPDSDFGKGCPHGKP